MAIKLMTSEVDAVLADRFFDETDKSKLFVLSWIEKGMYIDNHYSFHGTIEELGEIYKLYILGKSGITFNITEYHCEVTKNTRITGPDGHYHIVDGVEQSHSWEDCPENRR